MTFHSTLLSYYNFIKLIILYMWEWLLICCSFSEPFSAKNTLDNLIHFLAAATLGNKWNNSTF